MAESFDRMVKRTTKPEVIKRGRMRGKVLVAEMMMSDLRKMAGMSQRELAAVMGITQPSLSKLENQTDMQIATLRRMIAALGGEMKISAKLPGRRAQIVRFGGPKPRRRAA